MVPKFFGMWVQSGDFENDLDPYLGSLAEWSRLNLWEGGLEPDLLFIVYLLIK